MYFRTLSPLVIPVSIRCKSRYRALIAESLLVEDESSWSWTLSYLLSYDLDYSHQTATAGN